MITSKLLPGRAAAAARELRRSIHGSVLAAAAVPYDAARQIWNGAVDRHPGLIVRCGDDQDIAAAVRAAREHRLPLSVRGGGPDWAGRALNDRGLVLDLSAMGGGPADPGTRTGVAQGGATFGGGVAAAARYARAPGT